MQVNLTIPDREWYALAGKADKAGVKVTDLIHTAVRDLIANNPSRVVFRDQVGQLNEEGLPDPVIAQRLHVPVEIVRRTRRSLGLKHVRFRRDRWEHELTGQGTPANEGTN